MHKHPKGNKKEQKDNKTLPDDVAVEGEQPKNIINAGKTPKATIKGSHGPYIDYLSDDKFVLSEFIKENGDYFNVANIFLGIALILKTFDGDNYILHFCGNLFYVLFFVSSLLLISKIRSYNYTGIKEPYNKVSNFATRCMLIMVYIFALAGIFVYILTTPEFSDMGSTIIFVLFIAVFVSGCLLYLTGRMFVPTILLFVGIVGVMFSLLGWMLINHLLSTYAVDITSITILNYVIPTIALSVIGGMFVMLVIIFTVYVYPQIKNRTVTYANFGFYSLCIVLFIMFSTFLLTANYSEHENSGIVGTWIDRSSNDTVYYVFDNNKSFYAYNGTMEIRGKWANEVSISNGTAKFNSTTFNVTILTGNEPVQVKVHLNKSFSNITFDQKPLSLIVDKIDKNNYIYKIHV